VTPADPRLVRAAAPARRFLALAVVGGVVATALILLQAQLLAHGIAHPAAGWRALRSTFVLLLAVVAARALTAYLVEVSALRASAEVRSSLRRRLMQRVVDAGPGWLVTRSRGELVTVATRGLDALDAYFGRYLPQLVLACVVPLAVLIRVAGADLVSALVIAVTVPLIPIFMALVGMHTRARTQRQWLLLARLGGHFLDVVQGLPTLTLFGRARAQADVIRAVGDDHRRATMSTLRVAFLSALVLELLATLSTALVAVEVGLRLLAGQLPYETALLVLLLAPEAYLPLRAVGAQFHASMEGAVAVSQVLDILDEAPEAPAAGKVRRDLRHDTIELRDVSVHYDGRDRPAVEAATLRIAPGEHVALVGPSGAGKSTVLALLLRFVAPTSGGISVGDSPLGETDVDDWRRQIAWVPQSPHLFAGTVADNIRLGDPTATDDAVAEAASLAGLRLPDGVGTVVAEGGRSLSSGQRQRVALARAFLRDAPLLLLDEPTAHLDDDSADDLRERVRALMQGRTVVVVSHLHGWAGDAHRVVHVDGGRLAERAEAVA
jgi:ATP-binding cassette subfamily C protein CydD